MKHIVGVIIFVLVLTACSIIAPRFVNHKKPEVSLDFAAFEKAGCPPDKYGFRECKKDSPLYALGCDEISEPSDLLGALKPAYPIVLCVTFRDHILFDEIIPIEKSLQEKCDTSSDKVCLEQTGFISGTVQADCARTHSMVCDSYREALQQKCNTAPAKVCDILEGTHPIRMEVEEKVFNVEHNSTGDYAYLPQGNYFYSSGGLRPVLFRYVIFQDNHFVLIENEDEFRKVFVPLESPDEALAYVQAVTGLESLYDLEFDSQYEYFVDVVEDTHVDQVADGYLVYLYQQHVIGCGPHSTYQVTFHVTSEGIIQQQEVKQVFKNPAEDGMCVD